MACITYKDNEIQSSLQNKELEELVKKVCEATNEKWLIEEKKIYFGLRHRFLIKFLKKKNREPFYYRYVLYVKVNEFEWQIINFYLEKSESSINHYNTADTVYAFLSGILLGLKF
jgi:hypothetical protein